MPFLKFMPKLKNDPRPPGKAPDREGRPRRKQVPPGAVCVTPSNPPPSESPFIAGAAVDPANTGHPPITRYKIHPLALLLQDTDEEELKALADDITKIGQLNPATTLEGMILDGRRRYAACLMAGVDLRTIPLPPGIDPIDYVIAQNRHRRHMSASGLAIVAAKLMPHYAARAAERKKLLSGTRSNPNGSKTQVPEIVPGPDQCGDARELAAKAAGANPRYVSDAVRLQREAPELFKAVELGEKTIPGAMRQLKNWITTKKGAEIRPKKNKVDVVRLDHSNGTQDIEMDPLAKKAVKGLQICASVMLQQIAACPPGRTDWFKNELLSVATAFLAVRGGSIDPAQIQQFFRWLSSAKGPLLPSA
jgi:hypothetical protein